MQTLHGIRFVTIGRLDGTLLGLDAGWVGYRGLALMLALALATLTALLGQDAGAPLWLRLTMAGLMVPAVMLTSLGHELGHVVASRMAGLAVRAVVLGPQGGVTIRSGSDLPAVDFLTAVAGPMANTLFGAGCLLVAAVLRLDGLMLTFVLEMAGLQLLTAAANLVPLGTTDGRRMLTAWRALHPTEPLLPVV